MKRGIDTSPNGQRNRPSLKRQTAGSGFGSSRYLRGFTVRDRGLISPDPPRLPNEGSHSVSWIPQDWLDQTRLYYLNHRPICDIVFWTLVIILWSYFGGVLFHFSEFDKENSLIRQRGRLETVLDEMSVNGTTLHAATPILQEYYPLLSLPKNKHRNRWTIHSAAWFTFSTCATIGYGFTFPRTYLGKSLVFYYGLPGIALFGHAFTIIGRHFLYFIALVVRVIIELLDRMFEVMPLPSDFHPLILTPYNSSGQPPTMNAIDPDQTTNKLMNHQQSSHSLDASRAIRHAGHSSVSSMGNDPTATGSSVLSDGNATKRSPVTSYYSLSPGIVKDEDNDDDPDLLPMPSEDIICNSCSSSSSNLSPPRVTVLGRSRSLPIEREEYTISHSNLADYAENAAQSMEKPKVPRQRSMTLCQHSKARNVLATVEEEPSIGMGGVITQPDSSSLSSSSSASFSNGSEGESERGAHIPDDDHTTNMVEMVEIQPENINHTESERISENRKLITFSKQKRRKDQVLLTPDNELSPSLESLYSKDVSSPMHSRRWFSSPPKSSVISRIDTDRDEFHFVNSPQLFAKSNSENDSNDPDRCCGCVGFTIEQCSAVQRQLLVFFSLFFCCYFGALCLVFSEGWSDSNGFYYMFVSISTIGFGDLAPSNMNGRGPIAANVFVYIGLCLVMAAIQTIQSDSSQAFRHLVRGTVLRIKLRRLRNQQLKKEGSSS